MKINQIGRSMIEILGVLAIVGVLSIGGIMGYTKAVQKNKSNKAIKQVSLTILNVKTLYKKGSYSGLVNLAYNGNVKFTGFDYEQENGDLKLVHGLGGQAYVAACSRSEVEDWRGFCIVLYDLDTEGCVDILTNDWSNVDGIFAVGAVSNGCYPESDILEAETNSGIQKSGTSKLVAYREALPVPVSDAAEVCSNTNENTIIFKIK